MKAAKGMRDLDVNTPITIEDRQVIELWAGQPVPNEGKIRLALSPTEHHHFLQLLEMLGQNICKSSIKK